MSSHPSAKFVSLDLLLFLLLALLWSASFINIKVVVDQFPPIFSAMMRVLVSIACLAVIYKLLGKRVWALPERYWILWGAGLLTQAIPFACLFYGERFIAPALAGIINSTVSIWALLIGAFMFKDFSQWTWLKLTGLLLGLAGILMIFLPLVIHSHSRLVGVVAVLCMAFFYALGSLFNQHVIFKRMNVSFETNLFQQHVSSILFLMATSLSLETWPAFSQLLHLPAVLAFIYLGLMSTAIAWIIYFYLIREWGSVRAASVMYVVPLLAILWDFIFLHDVPSYRELAGSFTILLGVTLVQWTRKSTAVMTTAMTAKADVIST